LNFFCVYQRNNLRKSASHFLFFIATAAFSGRLNRKDAKVVPSGLLLWQVLYIYYNPLAISTNQH